MSFMVRMSILGTLLLVALCGLAWEYLVSIPGFNNAETMLAELSEDNIKRTAKDAVTRQEIREKFSKNPADVEIVSPPKKTSEYEIRAMFFLRYDTYKFYHALPWKTPNRIIVAYKRGLQGEEEIDKDPESFDDREWVLNAVYVNADPPPPPKPLPRDVTDRWDEMPMATGGGGGGKKMEQMEFSAEKMAPGKRAPEQDMPSEVKPAKKDEADTPKDAPAESESRPGEKKDEPKAEESKAEEPKADEPKADEPKAEESKAEESKAEGDQTEKAGQ